MRPDSAPKSPTPETSAPPSPRPAAVPTTRPRLNLQKRTVSEADPTSSPSAAGDAKASPFGAARPVDTAAKEREVEEKRQLAIRERKEADDKAKAERAKEKRQAKEDGEAEAESPRLTKQTSRGEEAEEEAKPTPPKFDILRRANSGNNDMLEEDEQEEQVDPSVDKEVKPKEIVVPASQVQNGSWRKSGPGPKSPAAKTTAENMDEEGWSTVSKPQKQRNSRRGGPRAIAS
jgi:translation initiation factor 4B